MKKIFEQSLELDNPGMAGGASYYDIEDIYQAFKDRLIEELGLDQSKEDEHERD